MWEAGSDGRLPWLSLKVAGGTPPPTLKKAKPRVKHRLYLFVK